MREGFYPTGSIDEDVPERILLSIEDLNIILIEDAPDRRLEPVEVIVERAQKVVIPCVVQNLVVWPCLRRVTCVHPNVKIIPICQPLCEGGAADQNDSFDITS